MLLQSEPIIFIRWIKGRGLRRLFGAVSRSSSNLVGGPPIPKKWTTLRIKSTGRDEFTLYGKRKIFAKDFHTTFRELLQRRILSFLENHQTNSSFNPWIPMGNLKRLRQTPLPSEALSQPSKVYSPTFFNRHLEQRAGETRKGPIGSDISRLIAYTMTTETSKNGLGNYVPSVDNKNCEIPYDTTDLDK